MQKSSKDFPKRGHIYIADLDPSFGREIHKKRPVLIISDDIYNQNTSYVVIIPSSSIIPLVLSPEMVLISKLIGLNKKSVLLPFYIRSIDQQRLIKKVGKISKAKLKEVEEAIKIVLDFK